jgi:hypothetical protein
MQVRIFINKVPMYLESASTQGLVNQGDQIELMFKLRLSVTKFV